jgi:hypothetical protein
MIDLAQITINTIRLCEQTESEADFKNVGYVQLLYRVLV